MALLPVILLAIGAAVTWNTRKRPPRVGWIVSSITAILVWLSSLAMITAIPKITGISVWRPETLFQSQIELQLDHISWPFIYASATLLLATVISHPARSESVLPGRQAILLVFASFPMVAMLSNNILTIATTWALMDVMSVLVLFALLGREIGIQRIIPRLAIDGASLVLILVAAVANIYLGGNGSLSRALNSPASVLLLTSAVFLRIGFLHLRSDLNYHPQLRSDIGILINLLPASVALAMLARVMSLGSPASVLPWLMIAGLIALLLGSVQWAFNTDEVRPQSAFILGISGAGIFIASSSGGDANAIIAAGVLMILVGSVVFSIEIFSPPHRIWIGLCGLAVVGCPGTPGGVLLASLFSQPTLKTTPNMAIASAGLVLLGVGTLRYFNLPTARWRTAESLVRFVYGLGLSLPVFVSIGLGLWMTSSLEASAMIGFFVVAALALVMLLVVRRVPYRNLTRWTRLLAWTDPRPIYLLVNRIFRWVLNIVRITSDIMEGEGALLWLVVILLLANLGMRGMV